ncbi:MAG TPA: SufD family Fe-S cluster assembly protein, partial [Sphingobacteriaceae bacterium]
MEKGIYNGFYQYLIGYFEKEHLPERAFEPSELLAKRARAFQAFNLKGLPSNRYEDWKYTNLNRLLKDDFKFQPTGEVPGYDVPQIPNLEACKIVLLNGRLVPEFSEPLPEGVRFFDSQSAIAQPEYVKKLGSLAVNEDNPILDLNTAFFKDFAVLHVTAKKLIDKPIHIIHHFTGNTSPAFVAYRMLVLAENLSETTVIETFHSNNEHPLLISYISEQEVGESAVLHSHLVNGLDEQVFLLHHREVDQHRNSVVNNMNVSLGEASLVRNELNFRLKGSGTQTNLWGSYVTSGRQHVDNHTVVDHQQPHCNSSELYKGIMTDRSHAVFNGKVIVRPDAQKTNAFQQNNN